VTNEDGDLWEGRCTFHN